VSEWENSSLRIIFVGIVPIVSVVNIIYRSNNKISITRTKKPSTRAANGKSTITKIRNGLSHPLAYAGTVVISLILSLLIYPSLRIPALVLFYSMVTFALGTVAKPISWGDVFFLTDMRVN
jgi:hypothetical protein